MAPIVWRRGMFTMQQCGCRASAPLAASRVRTITRTLQESLIVGFLLSSYNRPNEETHFYQRSAGGNRPLFARDSHWTIPVLQRSNPTGPDVWRNHYRRHCDAEPAGVG